MYAQRPTPPPRIDAVTLWGFCNMPIAKNALVNGVSLRDSIDAKRLMLQRKN